MNTTQRREAAELKIKMIESRGRTLGLAVETEMRLEYIRASLKLAAIGRIIGTENTLTGKPHSATSAEAAVETDQEYADLRLLQRTAARDTYIARSDYEAAKLTARLAVSLVEDGVETL